MAKKFPNLPGNAIVGFKIEHTTEEDDPKHLALLLVEQISLQRNKEQDAQAFSDCATAERIKANNLQFLLGQIKERKQLGTEYTSRMDPFRFYDEFTIRREVQLAKERLENFQRESDLYVEEAREAGIEVRRIQEAIREAHARQE